MKKHLAILLLLSILCLFACENVSYEETTSQSAPEQEKDIYEKLEESLPELTISDSESDGTTIESSVPTPQAFTIITNDPSVFVSSETAPGVINAAVEKRNDFLKSKYGANITAVQTKDGEVADAIKKALESGIEYCDMLSISARETATLALSGLLLDMNTLPDFDVNSSYFDAKNAKTLATNSTLYLLPDQTALVYEETFALFYNRILIAASKAEDPEPLVMQGKWTWDKFLEISKTAAADVYNKSTSDIETDTFAYAAYNDKYDTAEGETTYPLVVFASSGKKIIGNTYKNQVALSMDKNDMEDVAKRLKKYYDTKGKYLFEGNDAQELFEKGRMVFFCNKLEYLHNLKSPEDSKKGSEYGVLPLPKLDESQDGYSCLVSNNARVISVPKTLEKDSASRKQFVSYVIQANCAAGKGTVLNAYVSTYIKDFFVNNTEAYMFKTICESATFEFGNVFDSQSSKFRRASTTAIREYFEFGSDVSNSVNNGIKSFEDYCAKNFT